MNEASDRARQIAIDTLTEWLPGEWRSDSEYRFRRREDDRTPSADIDITTGRWHDFGDGARGTVLDLYAEIHGLSDWQAATERLTGERIGKINGNGAAKDRWAGWKQVAEGVEDWPEFIVEDWMSERWGENTARWPIMQNGRLRAIIVRFRHGDRKDDIPFTLWTNGTETLWRAKDLPTPRPVYGLNALAANPELPVVVFEGPRKAEPAADVIGDHYACVAWYGGTQRVQSTDWQPLAGRSVVIWPDADEPGRKAADTLAGILRGKGCSVAVVDPPDDVAQGWDIADCIDEGRDPLPLIESAHDPERIEIVSAESERTAEIPPRRWFLEGVLTVGLSILTAKKAIGKTFWLLESLRAIAAGDRFLGLETLPVPTLYVSTELDRTAIHERLDRYPGPLPDNFYVKYGWRSGEDGIGDLERLVKQHGIQVIAIDMFAAVLPENVEINAYELTPFLRRWRQEAHRLGICVLGSWHSAKADREDPMLAALGTTGIGGQADCYVSLDRKRGEQVTTMFSGGNHGKEHVLKLWFEECRWTLANGEDSVAECAPADKPILDWLRTGAKRATAPEIAALLQKSDNSTRAALSRLKARGVVDKEGYQWFAVTREPEL